jgi:Ferritin-like domain
VATAESQHIVEFNLRVRLNLEDTMNDRKINRRQALQNFGLVGVGAALAACTPGVIAIDPPAKKDIDVDVLNFALNLEYLEAEFYLWAAFGRGLSDADAGGGPASVGGKKLVYTGLPIDAAVQAYIEEIAIDEENHVKFLRKALGDKAVPRPKINIGGAPGDAFYEAGKAASNGTILGFDPYANALFFLHGAFIFEDVGVTAYKGASPLITNPGYLEAAAGILAVEAYHAGEIRTLLYSQRDVVAAAGLKVSQIVQAISDLRGSVGGGKDQGILGAGGKGNILPTDDNSIAFSRTTREVLNIAYGAKDATKGSFFPEGLNGAIK